MPERIFILLQYLTPHYLLTRLIGLLANSQQPWLKKILITQFIKRYTVNLSEAINENPNDYPSFNEFFIRQLKPNARVISKEAFEIACPVDGTISQIGTIQAHHLLQAKHYHYTLEELLGHDKQLAYHFYNGVYATLYLAPHNYHRVHMPLSGQLEQTIYVPGKLFSVNPITTESIPNLFSRNERLITIFHTHAGKMAVILIGAMIVGNIQTVWQTHPCREKKIVSKTYHNGITLLKGAELGYFKLGSTVILLYTENKTTWSPSLTTNSIVQLGQRLGNLHKDT
ncbi:MAG TPA: archaetidylserine decarboxylase [Gammaproteobacteria bacterium]|nr:archaetidylserine decarboxylase [Gammaproteobacteria bacterium]